MSRTVTPIEPTGEPSLRGLGTGDGNAGGGNNRRRGRRSTDAEKAPSMTPPSFSGSFASSTAAIMLDAQENSGLYRGGQKWQTTLLTLTG